MKTLRYVYAQCSYFDPPAENEWMDSKASTLVLKLRGTTTPGGVKFKATLRRSLLVYVSLPGEAWPCHLCGLALSAVWTYVDFIAFDMSFDWVGMYKLDTGRIARAHKQAFRVLSLPCIPRFEPMQPK